MTAKFLNGQECLLNVTDDCWEWLKTLAAKREIKTESVVTGFLMQRFYVEGDQSYIVTDYINAGAAIAGLSFSDFISGDKRQPLALIRQCVMYLACVEAKVSQKAIASILGYYDHTTVHYACKQIRSLKDQDSTDGNATRGYLEAILSNVKEAA
ncbi:helix-turn-helix domain-containing protein [Rubellicoccus peritrichatus]|uniref:Helix-turn-helix domain-containing protein n=1 Tax=Rubellicoccus peritrichatus TaxID=3080537 RepID=A0AAQ3QV70_9BACT|nr:helix-turn-helix domain-containing protein [Puniceicoccus sp. CR14]WOO43141.1 helix-turn-helix domain-containing protein [Puniceicoccus sp. CR14]